MNDIKRLLLAAVMLVGASAAYGDDCCGCGSTSNACCNSCNNDCNCDNYCGCIGGKYTNKTFFADYINFFQSGTYMHETLFPNCRMTKREDGWGGAFQIAVFGGKTTEDGRKDLGRWFGLNHSATLVVAEEVLPVDHVNALTTADVALDARHFNIQTTGGNFQSTISFCPEQKFVGAGLDWKQAFWRNEDDTARWWAELSGPVVHVKNSMGFREDVTTTGTATAAVTGLDGAPRVGNMTEAFAQTNWKYGKIYACGSTCCGTTTTTTTTTNNCGCGCDCDCDCGCDMEKTALAFLELKLGYNSVITECCGLGSYLGVIFPTGKEACPGMVFAPMVGGKHWGIMWGSEIGFTMWANDDAAIRMHFAIDARYLFKRDETRSFDLVGKPWGRYMEMYENSAAAVAAHTVPNATSGTSGINILTRCVKVTPRGQLNLNTGLSYEGNCFKAEIGHTWYGRQSEKICPNWDFTDTELPVLKSYQGNGYVAKARTIVDRFDCADGLAATAQYTGTETYYDGFKIQKCDVDWNSASHEAVLAHTIYGTLGYDWGEACYPTIVAIGGAYDFAESNSAMRRWTVFGKVGVSF